MRVSLRSCRSANAGFVWTSANRATHRDTKAVLFQKCISVSFPGTWRNRCERGCRRRLAWGHNVNRQECDTHHSNWFRRGVWRGEGVTHCTATKEMKHYPRDNQTPLKMPFQPIAIVCQVAGRVMGAFSSAADLRLRYYKSSQAQNMEGLVKQ